MNKEEADLIIAEQNKSKEEILKAVAKVKSDYHELCKLKDIRIADLEKENAEMKEKYVKNITDCDICDTYCNSQLTKAKEIIKKFSEFVNNEVEYDPEHPQEHTDLWNELCEQAEQFLSEVEK